MTPDDFATLQALTQGVDHAAREAEAKWGCGRLPLLVSDGTRAKFIKQQRRFREALASAYAGPVVTHAMLQAAEKAAGGMVRAWAVLDAEASARDCSPLSAVVWEVSLRDGTVVAVVRTVAEVAHVNRENRYVSVWTLAEVANVIDALSLIVTHNDDPSPKGPKVGQSRADYSWVEKGDLIPF